MPKKGQKWTPEYRKMMEQTWKDWREMRLDQVVEILDHYKNHSKIEGLNHSDLAKEMEMDRKSIRPYITQLLQDGTITKKGDKYVLT